MTKAEQILDKHIGFKTKMDLKKELVLEAMKEIAILSFDAGTKKDWIGGKNKEQFIEELFKTK